MPVAAEGGGWLEGRFWYRGAQAAEGQGHILKAGDEQRLSES